MDQLRAAFASYARARHAMLEALGLPASNRDPLAEFSEHLVKALVDGEFPPSRVQPDYDVIAADGGRIQVKYLANATDGWVNEHEIRVTGGMDEYAIVFFEALLPVAVIVFPARGMAAVGHALGKRHPHQDRTLQLTRSNYRAIVMDPSRFASLGVRVFGASGWIAGTEDPSGG